MENHHPLTPRAAQPPPCFTQPQQHQRRGRGKKNRAQTASFDSSSGGMTLSSPHDPPRINMFGRQQLQLQQQMQMQMQVQQMQPQQQMPMQPVQHHQQHGDSRTTVMLRNMPNNYTRAMFLDMMNSEGFSGRYNFIYLPIDFKSGANLGYAFVNLVSPTVVPEFWGTFDGFSQWVLPSHKVCEVKWSGPYQGLRAHIDRYRNSSLMHEAMPDIYKPMLFVDGVRAVFPPPTKKLRVPGVACMPNDCDTMGMSFSMDGGDGCGGGKSGKGKGKRQINGHQGVGGPPFFPYGVGPLSPKYGKGGVAFPRGVGSMGAGGKGKSAVGCMSGPHCQFTDSDEVNSVDLDFWM